MMEHLTLKNILLAIAIITVCTSLIAYGVYEEKEKRRGIEIILNSSFVGEVIEKEKIKRSYGMGGVNTYYVYYMYIIGEYLSEDNEVINVNRNFQVDNDLYNRYQVGDIISE